jgi:hypothetical protein
MRDKGGSGMGIKATDAREYMICEKPGMEAGGLVNEIEIVM